MNRTAPERVCPVDGPPDEGEARFRIGEAAELVGVPPHVLRYWETEFHVVPSRSATGQRLYGPPEIGLFLKIRRLLHDEKFTIAGARQTLSDGAEPPAGVDGGERSAALDRLAEARERVAALRSRIRRWALRGERER